MCSAVAAKAQCVLRLPAESREPLLRERNSIVGRNAAKCFASNIKRHRIAIRFSSACLASEQAPVAGLVSVGYVWVIAWADRNRPKGWRRLVAPILALGLLGIVSIEFPQLLGNGKDIAQIGVCQRGYAHAAVDPAVAQTRSNRHVSRQRRPGRIVHAIAGVGSIARGRSGTCLGLAWPGVSPGLFAVVGAAAVLAATTHGPISAVLLTMELTRHRSFIFAATVGGVHRHCRRAHSRPPFDLRRAPHRQRGAKLAAGTGTIVVVDCRCD